MAEPWPILTCLAACGVGYMAAQRLAMRMAIHRRAHAGLAGRPIPPVAGDALAALIGVQVCALFLLLTARPIMALVLGMTLIGLLLVINRVKEQVLREPLVLADAWLLPQIWQYPEMYLPFMPMRGLAIGTVVFAACIGLLAWVEPGVPRTAHAGLYALCACVAALPVVLLALLRTNRLPASWNRRVLRLLPVSHDAAADAARNGPLASAMLHPVLAGSMQQPMPDFLRNPHGRPAASRWPDHFERFLADIEAAHAADCPHVVLIQAESFCDIREHVHGAQKEALRDFLPNWDALKAAGRTLPTPENAYGAYTMRTEFSMLTGLHLEALGAFAFNPYILAARRPMWSLARFFKARGYATVCIHPYHKGFFQRNKVMANLGFDRFLGIEELNALERFGPYVSDAALGERIARELGAAQRPVFCFAISIEAHGPWQAGRLTPTQRAACLPDVPEGLFTPGMDMYLCHLRHMDTLFGRMGNTPEHRALWGFGDHPPSGLIA